MTIKHVVAWRLAAEDAAEKAAHAAEAVRRLQGLLGLIPEILELSVGANSLPIAGNWDLVLVAEFADEAALDTYQNHPAHLEAGAYVRSVVRERAAVDYEI